jgi:hypothetical protein
LRAPVSHSRKCCSADRTRALPPNARR